MVVTIKRTLFLLFTVIVCFSCSNKNQDQVGREFKATPLRNSALEFAGIESITSVTTTTVKINWSDVIEASAYYVFKSTPTEAESIAATVAAPASQVEIDNLSPNTSYTFKVRATDSQAQPDINTATLTATTKKEGTFSPLEDLSTTVGAAVTQTLDCSDEYSSTPTYTVESESDSHAHCSIVDDTVSCTPTTFTGHTTWTAAISVLCTMNGSTYSEAFELSVH